MRRRGRRRRREYRYNIDTNTRARGLRLFVVTCCLHDGQRVSEVVIEHRSHVATNNIMRLVSLHTV